MTTVAMLRRGVFVVPETSPNGTPEPASPRQVATAAVELLRLGFGADIDQLQLLDAMALKYLVWQAAILMGGDRLWRPLFPNFPQEQLSAQASAQLWSHWKTNLEDQAWKQLVEEAAALSAHEDSKEIWPENLRPLQAFQPTMKTLITEWEKPVGLSETDHQFVLDVATYIPENVLPSVYAATFHRGENLAIALEALLLVGHDADEVCNVGLAKARTVDDLLRVVLACYCHDPARSRDLQSSPEYPLMLKPIPRKTRRTIVLALSVFDNAWNLDLLHKRRVAWRRVLRRIHPYDFPEHTYATTQLDVVFANGTYRTTNAQVEDALASGDVVAACALLADNPGHLLRRLDHLMRLATFRRTKGWQAKARAVEEAVAKAAPHAKLSTLITLRNSLNNRDSDVKLTQLGDRTVLRTTSKKKLDPGHRRKVIAAIDAAISHRLTLIPPPHHPLPIGNREPVLTGRNQASKSIEQWVRGQRISLGKPAPGAVLRIFSHWYGANVDLALSLADSNLSKQVAYVDHSTPRGRWGETLHHSGDVTDGSYPRGGCEFINVAIGDRDYGYSDCDPVQEVLPAARYLIPVVISFDAGTFDTLDCFTGAMLRDEPLTSDVFQPRTVKAATTITARSTVVVPFVVDLDRMELIWLDASAGTRRGYTSVTGCTIPALVKAELSRLSAQITVGDLLRLWASAHDHPTVAEEQLEFSRDLINSLLAAV
ncbi:MAG: hypothetical protein Q4D85_00005 [Corynebacterium sp.]|uniref:hypothetical protein n=1 Tax=Corynebacterium sp. TaxID=1720 RepID=UPI0026DC2F4D|nr:hypothetical protein [Corynebacterium sp.]MDO5097108.1 hypothetical protein [Corynebacterium sp.]